MVAASVGTPTNQKMESTEELIARINDNTAAQKEQTERWRLELGLPERKPTELELLLQKWEQAREALLAAAPEGEAPLSQEEEEEEELFLSPEPLAQGGGGEQPTSNRASATGRGRYSGAVKCGPVLQLRGHQSGMPRPPSTRPCAQVAGQPSTVACLVPY
ncbi:UNVERIFIED_CONTAM: hypothetical protein FKN15_039640 [Acipenser sinensis]